MNKKSEEIYYASEAKLIWWRFRRNKLAIIGMIILLMLYVFGIFAEFFAPYDPNKLNHFYVYAPPQRVRIIRDGKLVRPYVYGYKAERDPETLQRIYIADES